MGMRVIIRLDLSDKDQMNWAKLIAYSGYFARSPITPGERTLSTNLHELFSS